MPTTPLKIAEKENYKKLYFVCEGILLRNKVLYIESTIRDFIDSICIINSIHKNVSVTLKDSDWQVIELMNDPNELGILIKNKFIKKGRLITVELFNNKYKQSENNSNKFNYLLRNEELNGDRERRKM